MQLLYSTPGSGSSIIQIVFKDRLAWLILCKHLYEMEQTIRAFSGIYVYP